MRERAQSIIEYCVLLGIVALSLSLMFPYLRNHLQGRYKSEIDTFSDEQYTQTGDPQSMLKDSYSFILKGYRPIGNVVILRPREGGWQRETKELSLRGDIFQITQGSR